MNILLIVGGWSSEREVSLNGGKTVAAALARLGHRVTEYDPQTSLDDLPAVLAGQDFAFIGLHGSPGEDGVIQAMLERLGCPYQGSGPAASMLALNKVLSKILFRRAGLLTADWVCLTQKPEPGWLPPFAFPFFIKANTGGSSLHMEKVEAASALPAALERLFALESQYLVESALTGCEVTCAILEERAGGRALPRALPPILIKPANASGLFDYVSKYQPGGAEEICPAPLPEALTLQIQQAALTAHQALGLAGYSRSDFIVTPDGRPFILEVNTLPGMTATSLLPQAAAAVGLSFDQLIARLVELGMARE